MTAINPNIRFTEAALSFTKKMVEKDSGLGLRLSINKTGCSGYAYKVEVIKEMNLEDVTFEVSNGLKICVDSKWLHFFDGLRIDYVQEDDFGLKQTRLVFLNDHESSRCGCGKSFQIEKDEK